MARLLVLMACAGPVAGFHEHIVHHVGGLFGGGGSYEEGHVPEPRYLYDELGNVIPFDPKDQHGKDCYDECESAGPCNFCGPSGACCQDGHEGLGCKAEGNPCGAEAFCCTADTNLDNLGVPIPEYICVNGTVNGETGVNATNCNATVLDALKQNYLVVIGLILLIVLLLAFAMSAAGGPKGGATQMA
mmetsp:Transcript_32222/g.104058  ORF Transcript_32222/g.104058 Transcript_32222/m.104058 type:complete len:188 (-) Transcript_32222:363-926(-)